MSEVALREFIHAEVSRIKEGVESEHFSDVQYRKLAPIHDSGPNWGPGIVRYDSPEFSYSFTLDDAHRAMSSGVELSRGAARSAMHRAELFVDALLMEGDTTRGLQGLINSTFIDGSISVPVRSTESWEGDSLPQITAKIDNLLQGGHHHPTDGALADTLLLPDTLMLEQPFLRQQLLENNAYTVTTGQPLTLRGCSALNSGGHEGGRRAVAYLQESGYLKFHLPTSPTFLEEFEHGPGMFVVQCIFYTGGLKVLQPEGIRYLDGI